MKAHSMTQEKELHSCFTRRSVTVNHHGCVSNERSLREKMEATFAQLKQELMVLRDPVRASAGFQESVQAINK